MAALTLPAQVDLPTCDVPISNKLLGLDGFDPPRLAICPSFFVITPVGWIFAKQVHKTKKPAG